MSSDTTNAAEVSLGGETAKATAAKFTMAAIGFLGAIASARLLGRSDFGGYFLLFTAVKIADRPISGVAQAGKKRFSEPETPREEILGVQLAFIVLWVAVSVAGAFLLAGPLRSYTGVANAPTLFAVLLVAVGLYEPLDNLVQAQGRVGVATWIDTGRSVLTTPAQLLLILLGAGVTGMAAGLVIATLLCVPVMAWTLGVRPAIPSRETVSRVWAFARYSIPNALVGKAYNDFDRLLLGVLFVSAVAGDYVAAAKLALPAMFVASTATQGLMPRVSNLAGKGRAVAQDVTNTLGFASVLAVPVAFGAAALPGPLMATTFGTDYAGGAAFLVWVSVYYLLRTQRAPLSGTIGGLDHPEWNTWISATTLTVNVVAGVALAVWIGPVGVVVASVLAEGIRYVASALLARRLLPTLELVPRPLRAQLLAGAAMFLAVEVVAGLVPLGSVLSVVGLVALGGVSYFGVLLPISPTARATVESVVVDLGIGRRAG